MKYSTLTVISSMRSIVSSVVGVSILPGRSVSVADFKSRENEESEIDDNVAPLSLESDSEDGQKELMEPETETDGQEQNLDGYDDPKFTLPTLEDISIDDFLEIN
ncbi:hypothetical protein FQA39_LY07254 [Lamprigera yunnana]|nr:hypothetical protein FQA39_LY07254 [Lamprigera yunnana]